MSTTATQLHPAEVELTPIPTSPYTTRSSINADSFGHSVFPEEPHSPDLVNETASDDAPFSTDAIPDGGYGWMVVFCASAITFWIGSTINCWGILQTALLNSTLSHVSTSTVSFIGSLNLACGVAFGLLSTRLTRWLGTRFTTMVGIVLMGVGMIAAGFCTGNVAGLFLCVGVVAGIGINITYTVCNVIPLQYFSGRLGLANGLIKLGGGIGATVMAIALEALVRRVGIEWTFRIQGFLTIATGLPAAWFLKERVLIRNAPFIELSMFRNLAFTAMFLSGAIGTASLFVAPFYLPLFAQSLGLSSTIGAALVAAFNACNAIGRFAGGPLCDKIGPTNTFVIMMSLNAVSMLAIWPVSSTLGPLALFSVLNGVANGSYFTVFPTVVATIFGPGRAAVAMSLSTTGWTLGYLMGAPIAGFLLQAGGGEQSAPRGDIGVYRPAIFYAGGIAFLSSLFALVARVYLVKTVQKRKV
ncbi:MFS general substrate transporter [Aaosphaeria arxii CBS 175.79]|uniref:MFS general substrate transporter n=1 Tax=Aaosphaeria arxii CBS 175.79 TaxID=1450172 RepID=A0A6A5XXV8_9PLEO|nr:MFS general substrate transporter [Aaosphaeria arxii CBS 175.79]KAF2018138.1 MFS general substrate transporter [Aaosphaeria arxii CBS 175.79]